MRRIGMVSLFVVLLALPGLARAQEPAPEPGVVDALKKQIEALQAQIDELRARLSEIEESRTAKETPATTPLLNPDISVIGDFLYTGGRTQPSVVPVSDGGGLTPRALELRELELAFQAPVDPFGRADVFLTFTPEGTEVEEAYLTVLSPHSLGLPPEVTPRLGKMRSSILRINTSHTHFLPQADIPAVARRFLGPDGMSQPGVEMQWLLPTRSPFMELTAAAYGGSDGAVFGTNQNYLARLRSYWDLSDTANVELGISAARGMLDPLGERTLLSGSFVYRWKPQKAGAYRSLWWQTEILKVADAGDLAQHPLGYYSFVQYQLNKEWYVGGRWDWTDIPTDLTAHETGLSGVLTYFPSEFTRYRLQLGDLNQPELGQFLRVMLEVTFMLGPHRAHPF